MNKVLHILNGDSTAFNLSKSGIAGEVVVWREMLCEGPVHHEVGSDEFWKKRYAYFENEIGTSKIDYYDKTIKEIIKLEDVSGYDEVVLWFEFDLFCQINLLALCSYILMHYRKKVRFSLICVGEIMEDDSMIYLGGISFEDYGKLFDSRIKLNRNDFRFAYECWKIYVGNDKDALANFDFRSNRKFKYLSGAIQQHLKRFPGTNGLNQIENKILQIIQSEPLKKNEIVYKLLDWQDRDTVYGFGDLQYNLKLKNIQEYYTVEYGRFVLNQRGEKIVNE